MQVREYLTAFIDHEERAQLFERSACGVRYWQAIRHDVFQETLQAAGLAERAHKRVGELPIRNWLPAQLRALPSTLQRSVGLAAPPLPRRLGFAREAFSRSGLTRTAGALFDLPRAELLIANHPRHVFHDGNWICPYTQPLLDSIHHTHAVLEGQFQGRYAPPVPAQPTAYVDLALLAAHAEFRAASLRGRGFSQTELSELAGIREGLARALGAAPPRAALVRRARTAILAYRGLWPRYSRLLDRVQPRLVINVIGYRLVHQVLTEVAHSRGLRVAELQHGSLGETHPAYNFAPGRRPDAFPDELLLFGKLWRDATPGLPLPAAQTPAIGYAWLELQKNRFKRLSPTAPRRVLFLSQGSIGPELARAAVQLRERFSPSELHVSFRLHPSEHAGDRDPYPELTRAGVEVQAAASQPLYAVQRDSDAQVGVYSTALLEGLAFGLPTYVLALPGHEQLRAVTSAGAAQLVPDAAALADVLRQPPAAAAAAVDALWTPNATANFQRFLERALA
jgi:hypothetical protein